MKCKVIPLSDPTWHTGGNLLYTLEIYTLFCGDGRDVNPVFLLPHTAGSETAKITKINLIWGPYK